jgi:hypothetical protein
MKLFSLSLALCFPVVLGAGEPAVLTVKKGEQSVVLQWSGGSGVYQLEATSDLRT